MKSNKRIFRTLLCIAVLFAVAFSAIYIVAESGHDCTGEHCAICHQIELCKNLLRSLTIAAGAAGACVVGKTLCRYCRARHNDRIVVPTLISLRVKLSD